MLDSKDTRSIDQRTTKGMSGLAILARLARAFSGVEWEATGSQLGACVRMGVNNAAYPRSLGPGFSAPYHTSENTSQYDPVPGLHRSVGQDTHRYHSQDSARTAMRHPRNAAGYSDQYPVGNAGDYDANRDYYHPVAPNLDSRVIEGPRYPADPYDGFSTKQIQYGQPLPIIAGNGVAGQPLGDYGSQVKSLYEAQQSDDDYQRHNADRYRREGRAQDRFGQRDQGTSKMSEYFLNGEGIDVDVLRRRDMQIPWIRGNCQTSHARCLYRHYMFFSEPR